MSLGKRPVSGRTGHAFSDLALGFVVACHFRLSQWLPMVYRAAAGLGGIPPIPPLGPSATIGLPGTHSKVTEAFPMSVAGGHHRVRCGDPPCDSAPSYRIGG